MDWLTFALTVCLFASAEAQWRNSSQRVRKNKESIEPTWHWIDLPLDYYNVLDERTFKGRYLTNDQFYKKGGPLVVYIGGEWAIADYGVMGGVQFQLAKKYNGYILYTEHRFFGESTPFPSSEWTNENLRYITPDFSVADVIYVIDHVQKSIDGLENSQVIAIGASYSGSMSIWARYKYPHKISMTYNCGGVISSDFYNEGYRETTLKVFLKTNPKCWDVYLEAIIEGDSLLKSKSGNEKLQNLFPYLTSKSYGYLLNLLNIINPQIWPVYKLTQVCHYLVANTTGTSLERLHDLVNDYLPQEELAKEEDVVNRWFFFLCTFLGNFLVFKEDEYNELFSGKDGREAVVRNLCTQYGSQFTVAYSKKRIDIVDLLYGGTKPDVTKVLSVQGTHDPWKTGSIADDLNDQSPVVYVADAFHCLELGEEQPDETPQVAQSKTEILEQLEKWIV